MAPEVFKGDPYTMACDVYSFGSVLLDIAVGGKLSDVFGSNKRLGGELERSLADGWRPELGVTLNNDFPVIHKLIKACWHQNPDKRPTFKRISAELDR